MSDKAKKSKNKRVIPLRTAGETVAKPENRPSKNLFDEVLKAERELESTQGTPGTWSTPSTQSTPTTQSTPGKKSFAPEKDWHKVSNAIVREAIPDNLFGSGKGKQLYDTLYNLTIGSIKETDVIRISKPKLMKSSGIGSDKTLDKNLNRLEEIGLIKITTIDGEHRGNEYKVYKYEDRTTHRTQGTPSTPGYPEYPEQNLPQVPVVETTQGTLGSQSINIGTSDAAKTFFKDNKNNDDEPQARIFAKLEAAAFAKTGKGLTEKDYAVFEDAIDLLIAETEVAAARTNSISAYIPFLTENLRRRLHAKPRIEKKGSEPKKDRVGETRISEPQPLNEEAKQIMLESYRKFLSDFGMDWVDQNEEFFTPEDWQWIKSELAKIEEQE